MQPGRQLRGCADLAIVAAVNATAPTAPASTSPAPDLDLAARLRGSEIFRHYQDAFQTATGLPLVLRAAGSFETPLHGSSRLNPFCAFMAATNKTCAACLELQQRIEDNALVGSSTLECFAGLNESAVPVRIGERVIAYLQTGQIMLRAPTPARFKKAMRQLAEWNASLDEPALRTAYFKTRVLSRAHYAAILRLLSSFAQHLALLSNELMITEANAESPTIARARTFIAEHFEEDLSLGCVAGAVHVSATYFCKLFKTATGLRFTDYVARVRVEAVKRILLNPHKRVSEAAYEAGFQSLSQFNRVFRRVAGESPSDYRDRLHGPAGHDALLAPAA